MSEYYGGDYIYNSLSNDAGIATIVGTDIYNTRIVPEVRPTTGAAVGLETINFYLVIPPVGAVEIPNITWSIDCRSASEITSIQLANLVFLRLNRVSAMYDGVNYYGIVDVGATLPPADSSDVYNTPVSFTMRRH